MHPYHRIYSELITVSLVVLPLGESQVVETIAVLSLDVQVHVTVEVEVHTASVDIGSLQISSRMEESHMELERLMRRFEEVERSFMDLD